MSLSFAATDSLLLATSATLCFQPDSDHFRTMSHTQYVQKTLVAPPLIWRSLAFHRFRDKSWVFFYHLSPTPTPPLSRATEIMSRFRMTFPFTKVQPDFVPPPPPPLFLFVLFLFVVCCCCFCIQSQMLPLSPPFGVWLKCVYVVEKASWMPTWVTTRFWTMPVPTWRRPVSSSWSPRYSAMTSTGWGCPKSLHSR